MKFYIKFQKTALHIAIELGKTEIVRLLLSYDKINVNATNILSNLFFNEIFKIILLLIQLKI